jgi:hypothetical protein
MNFDSQSSVFVTGGTVSGFEDRYYMGTSHKKTDPPKTLP